MSVRHELAGAGAPTAEGRAEPCPRPREAGLGRARANARGGARRGDGVDAAPPAHGQRLQRGAEEVVQLPEPNREARGVRVVCDRLHERGGEAVREDDLALGGSGAHSRQAVRRAVRRGCGDGVPLAAAAAQRTQGRAIGRSDRATRPHRPLRLPQTNSVRLHRRTGRRHRRHHSSAKTAAPPVAAAAASPPPPRCFFCRLFFPRPPP